VVDDAIVVGEHADFRARTLGEDPVTPRRTRRAAWPAGVFGHAHDGDRLRGLVAIGGRFGD
jgi:hypothetical protein